ncbi:MAG: DUF4384 domain-containing protein [Nitrospiraceae bacterium]|nr:DUF4384 domain-containing protein [Nitrospiraceae bacterium]
MRGGLTGLSVLLPLLLLVPGCATHGGPGQKVPGETLNPPSGTLAAPGKKPVGPPRSQASPMVSSAPPMLPPCGSLSISSSKREVEFLMAGEGVMGKTASDRTILDLAEREAISRLDRCTGIARMLSGFYDKTHVPDPGDRQKIFRKIKRALDLDPRFRVVRESCREEGERRSCQVVIEGTVRRLRRDPAFSIRSMGIGKSGVLQEGETMHIRFSLTRPATVYLFNVDERGRATLLFPGHLGEEGGIPAGTPVVIPPENQKAVTLVATLSSGMKNHVGHIWILALEGRKIPKAEDLWKKSAPDGTLPVVGNFFGGLLPKVSPPGKGGGWSLRVIPYQIVGKGNASSGKGPGEKL